MRLVAGNCTEFLVFCSAVTVLDASTQYAHLEHVLDRFFGEPFASLA